MMPPGLVLRFTHQQVTQLRVHCSAYRAYLWRFVLPSPERNQALRSIQGLQARLEQLQEQGQAPFALSVSLEEKITLTQLFPALMQHYGAEPASAQRSQKLAELGSLRVLVGHMVRQTQTIGEGK